MNYLVMSTLLCQQYPTVAHILIHSVNLPFGLESGFKNKVSGLAGIGPVISGSGRVWSSK